MLKNKDKNEKRSLKKLRIATKTVRNLTESQLDGVAGGSMTSGTVFGGACCLLCGCIRSETCPP